MSTQNENKRTLQQNKRLHQWMRELAVELNNRGLYLQKVLKPTWETEWTEDLIKSEIVTPLAQIVAQTSHTSELNKVQLSKIIDIIDKNLLTKFDVDLPFSDETDTPQKKNTSESEDTIAI